MEVSQDKVCYQENNDTKKNIKNSKNVEFSLNDNNKLKININKEKRDVLLSRFNNSQDSSEEGCYIYMINFFF